MIFGDPNRYEPVNSTYQSRFHQLNNRELDLLLQADSHTLEREVREVRSLILTSAFATLLI